MTLQLPIVIVDYGMGNLRSVQKAFWRCGAHAEVTSCTSTIRRAGKIVLPGVGAFAAAMEELKHRRLIDSVREKIETGAPYLGLCLGLQLLFERSEESRGKQEAEGLGIIPGKVRHFHGSLKVPHMGWNTLTVRNKECPLFRGIGPKDYFYFVHSYYAEPKDPSWTAATTGYGTDFCSALWRGNIFATQFHPEKSQTVGLRVLKNFIAFKG